AAVGGADAHGGGRRRGGPLGRPLPPVRARAAGRQLGRVAPIRARGGGTRRVVEPRAGAGGGAGGGPARGRAAPGDWGGGGGGPGAGGGLARRSGDATIRQRAEATLGFAALSRSDAAEAVAWLGPARAELQRQGIGELSISQVVQNEIEALIALGRLDEAGETIAFVEDKGRASGRAWHAARAARGRAPLTAAPRDHHPAPAHIQRA